MRNSFTPAVSRFLLLPAIVALLANCSGESGGPMSPLPAPASAISAAGSGFYFAPPIQPALASYPGTFDGTRSPTVEVCRWGSAACSGLIVATFSRAAGTLSVDNSAQLYRADWTTIGLAAGVTYRVQVLEQGTVIGFADARVPAPGETPTQLTAQGVVPLGNSSRLPIRFRLERVTAAPTVTITAPADGTVFPAGAPITFSATATDPQQGNVSGQIVWRSSQVSGNLGTGATITPTLAGGRHTITASVTSASGVATASIQIVVSIISVPATLNVPFGGTASLPITLTQQAPAGGLTFAVSTAAGGIVGVAATTVTIPAGQQSANVTLNGVAPGTATISVSNANYGSASSQVSTTANLSIAPASVRFAAGRTQQITIQLESQGAAIAAPPGGIAITLVSSSPGCVAATSPVTIPAGLVSVVSDLSYGGSAATTCTAQVTASVGGLPAIAGATVNVTIDPSPTITVNVGSARVGAGLRASLSSLSLAAPAPAGGVTVTLTSSSASVLLVSDAGASTVGTATATVNVPAGGSSALFYMHGNNGAAGTATVTAAAPGYANATSSTITVAGVAIDLLSLPTTSTVLSPDDPFIVRVGVLDAAGSGLYQEQEVRPGGATITATVTNSASTVAQLTTTAGSAQSRTVTVVAGQSRSPSTVATGGVAFDPLGGGITTVAATAPGAVSVAGATQAVTVSAPTMVITPGSARLGAGLRSGLSVLSLGAPAPAGGLTITLSSSAASVLLVSDDGAATAGTGTATLTLAAGAPYVFFYMHGNNGAAGTATVTASAPGYTSTTSSSVVVASAAIELLGLPATSTTLSPDDAFLLRVGVVDAAGTGIYQEQEVRPSGATIIATVTNSASGVAQLTTSAGSAQSRTVSIVAGQSRSASTVATGGIAFDPLGGGITTVAATAPGVVSVAGASQGVTVSAPTFVITPGGARVGAGLRSGVSVLSLGAPAPTGGLLVTVTSSAPGVLLVSDDGATTVGTGTATLTVAAGAPYVFFYMHGNNGAAGTGTVTASAPGYTAATSSPIVVASPAIDLLGLPTTSTTLSPDDAFLLRVGVVDAAGTGLYQEQEVRPSGASIIATVTNSASSVAQLTTAAGSGQSRSVTIVAGQSRSPSTVAAGGIAFDPLAAGTTTVAATAPGVVSVAASQAVTISAPTIVITPGGARLGAGLRSGVSVLSLGAPAPAGGLTVTVASSAPGVLLVSDDGATTVGTGTATLTVAAGAPYVFFYMHGNNGASGTATVTASAPGFTDGTTAVTVAPAAIDIIGLGTTTTAGSANTAFLVRVSVVDAAGTGFYQEQEVRPGGAAITATVTNSAAGVARLTTSGGSGQTRSVTIASGQSRSPFGAPAGGIEFDPLAVGTTTVAASAPGGVLAVSGSSVTVSVTP